MNKNLCDRQPYFALLLPFPSIYNEALRENGDLKFIENRWFTGKKMQTKDDPNPVTEGRSDSLWKHYCTNPFADGKIAAHLQLLI